VSEDPILTLRLLIDEVVTSLRAVTAGKSLSELSPGDLASAVSVRTQERIFEVVITESDTPAECVSRLGIALGMALAADIGIRKPPSLHDERGNVFGPGSRGPH
jgi:class 3 adenylate cyclase